MRPVKAAVLSSGSAGNCVWVEADGHVVLIDCGLSVPELGRRLAPLRESGTLIIGSGFTTHGLPYLDAPSPNAVPPQWSVEFDHWSRERFDAGDVDGLLDFAHRAPGMPYAHPRTEHFAPLFVTLGAATAADAVPAQPIDGFWMGLAKRSIVVS